MNVHKQDTEKHILKVRMRNWKENSGIPCDTTVVEPVTFSLVFQATFCVASILFSFDSNHLLVSGFRDYIAHDPKLDFRDMSQREL